MGIVIIPILFVAFGLATFIGRWVGGRARWGVPLGLLGVYVFALAWPPGIIDAQIACWRNGGLHGTVPKVEGFWFGSSYGTDCDDCKRLVIDGLFRYVDYQAAESWAPKNIVKGQFYRVSRGPKRKTECSPPGQYVDVRSMPEECFTVTLLPGAPTDGFRSTSDVRSVRGVLGSELRMHYNVLEELKSGKTTLALISREYKVWSPIDVALTGGSTALYMCPRNPVRFDKFMRLISLANHRE